MLDEKSLFTFIVSMFIFKKITALILLGLLTLILIGTGTGLHIHHGDHGFENSTHATGAHDTDGDDCAQHCEGEPLLEHFLENHGSLFNSGQKIFISPLVKTIVILPVNFTSENRGFKISASQEVLPDHQYRSSTASGRAPPFSS